MRITFSILIIYLTILCLTSKAALAETIPYDTSVSAKEWTFLIYLNGNNNLDSFGTTNINQMEQVGSTDQINIVVQWASLTNKKTERIYITKDSAPNQVTSPVVQELGSVDMGNWKNLADFIMWGVSKYPAKHYFINVWDHGSGWHPIRSPQIKSIFFPMDISWDDNTGNSISTPQLGQALALGSQSIGHKIDLFATDACLMAMAEIATEVSGSVDFYAGSEEVEPAAGWPYQTILDRWSKTPNASASEVGIIVTEEYVKSFSGGSNGTRAATYSVFDMNKMDSLHQSISNFGNSLMSLNRIGKENTLRAARSTQSFTYGDYGDLLDFLSNLSKVQVDTSVKDSALRLQETLKQFIIANSTTSDYQKAKGLSIWLPTDLPTYRIHSDQYQTLKFNSMTHWNNALQVLLH